jgi:hypothetical protein
MEFSLLPKLLIEIRHNFFCYIPRFPTPYPETHVQAIRGFPDHILKDKVSARDPPKCRSRFCESHLDILTQHNTTRKTIFELRLHDLVVDIKMHYFSLSSLKVGQ